MDAVLGLGLEAERIVNIPTEIARLAQERKAARENKDFKTSDELRDKINSSGWQIEDLANNEYRLEKING
jgi:cysteinyl-tRNA synthetase